MDPIIKQLYPVHSHFICHRSKEPHVTLAPPPLKYLVLLCFQALGMKTLRYRNAAFSNISSFTLYFVKRIQALRAECCLEASVLLQKRLYVVLNYITTSCSRACSSTLKTQTRKEIQSVTNCTQLPQVRSHLCCFETRPRRPAIFYLT
jgi:hypothetical protein